MRKFALALGLMIAGVGVATPALADGKALAFQSVAPEGLDATAAQMVEALQAGMPGQVAQFAAGGYSYYGALAVPKGVALKPELLISVANLETAEAAQSAALEACQQQTGASCTVIGLLVPAGN